MRIAIFTDSFLPYRSGVTTVVENQSREMLRRGHEVRIFRARPWKSSMEDKPAANVVNLPLSLPAPRVPGLYLAAPLVMTAYRQMKRWRPDVVHLNTEFGCGWEGLIAARLRGIPAVGTFHTFFAEPGYLRAIGLPDWRWIRAVMWQYSVFFYSRCHAVTSPSQAVKDALLEHGVDPEPMVVSNGIPEAPQRTSLELEETRRKYKLENLGDPVFIHVGRLSPEKSLDILLRGFQRVAARAPKASLLIVGDGPMREELSRLSTELGLDQNISLLGHVPHEDLIDDQLLQIGDVFVTASKTENQPLSIMEAMTSGLPVIGANSRGIPELVKHGQSGLLFPPDDVERLADAMLQMAGNQVERRAMGDAAREGMQSHTISGVIDQFEQIYGRIVSTKERVASRKQRQDSSAIPGRVWQARNDGSR